MTTTLKLPASVEAFYTGAIKPALALLPSAMDSPEAHVLLIAIALQESGLRHRWQVVDLAHPGVKGPARGLLQFEKGTAASRGGVTGVFLHPASRYWLSLLCSGCGCAFTPQAIWHALESDDVLAVGVARLLLFTDPKRLPAVDDEDGAWTLYAIRTWRPGKPHLATWAAHHRRAREFVAERAKARARP